MTVRRFPRLARALLAGLLFQSAPAHAVDVSANGFPATLVESAPGTPCALFISGSGPTDRNGNNPLGISANYLEKLANALEKQEISSLRYDKRGVAGSIDPGPEKELRVADFVADAARVVDWYAHECKGPIAIIGHSEGALIALELAADRSEKIAALVLVASPGRPVSQTLRKQLEAMDAPLREDALRLLEQVLAGTPADDVPAPLMALFRPSVQPYLRSLLNLQPALTLARTGMPVLVIGGGRDLQVERADFDVLSEARKDVDSAWFEDMNHVLTAAPEDRIANFATYRDPDAKLHEGLVARISDFLRRADTTQ